MRKLKALINSSILQSLLIIFVIMMFSTAPLTPASAQPVEMYKQKVAQKIARDWIDIAIEQYRRALYAHAEQSLLNALRHRKYLMSPRMKQLNGLLEQSHSAELEQTRVLKHGQIADELIEQDKLIEAKAHLEKVRASTFLTKEHRAQNLESIRQLNDRINERKKEIAEIYKRSVKSYKAGRFEEAREGFITVAGNGLLTMPRGKTAEDYLLKIEKVLTGRAEQQRSQIESKPDIPKESIIVKPAAVTHKSSANINNNDTKQVTNKNFANINVTDAEPLSRSSTYHHVHRRLVGSHQRDKDRDRDNVLKSYIKAVINDTSAKVQNYITNGEFNTAKETVDAAEQILSIKRTRLGDTSFRKYSSQLKQLAENIAKEKSRFFSDWDSRTAWNL